jgi:putative transposase
MDNMDNSFRVLPAKQHTVIRSGHPTAGLITRRSQVPIRVVRILPNKESCRRLIRALAVETHEGRLEEHRYLNMQLLAEHKREQLRQLEEAA